MRVLIGFIVLAVLAALTISGYNAFELHKFVQKTETGQTEVKQSDRDYFKLELITAENRLLRDEINELKIKPTYDNGYRDAIIHMGGPQNPGSYADGWNSAMKVFANQGYADGYHSAIKQFSYTGPMLIAPQIATKPIGSCPAHEGK